MAEKTAKLIDRIPRRHKSETGLFQAHVDRALLAQVIRARREDDISWRDLIETFFRMYLEQRKTKKNIA